MACAMLRKAADNTNVFCGDGTTTSTIIAASIFKKGQRMIAAGNNPIRLKKGIEIARNHIIDFLDEIKLDITSREDLRLCAMVFS
jgi:chaperonin GroEL